MIDRGIAAYAAISQGAYSFIASRETTLAALQQAGAGGFTEKQARRFLFPSGLQGSQAPAGFEFRDQKSDSSTGLSATVFFDGATNKFVLGIRGTETGILDIAEDVNRIGLQGFAGDQLVSLYRYYRRLTTAAGQTVQYSDSEIAKLRAVQLGIGTGMASLIFNASRTASLRRELAKDVGITPENGGGPAVIPAGVPIVVAGHSLGGHLALLFGRFFPEVTEHIYTYNAPGISPFGEWFLRKLGYPPSPDSLVTNVSSVMGDELISKIWSKPGEVVGVATEAGGTRYNHFIVPLTDALALYDAFGTLSPGLDARTVGEMIAAASPFPEDTLEVMADHLGVLLDAGNPPTQIASSVSDLAQRDSYYANLYAALDGREPGLDYEIESLAGLSGKEIAGLAEEHPPVRFALRELMPFAALSADDADGGEDVSSQWIASRAELLAAMLEGNAVERRFGLSGTPENLLFVDLESGVEYAKLDGVQARLALPISALADRGRLRTFLADVPYSGKVVFGTDSSDDLPGLAGADRLFGGAGADRLTGLAGGDYLEGGPGDDVLLGGPGDDTLAGGEGQDRLEGGAGSDSYVFAEVLDADTIVDRDGFVFADGEQLVGGVGNPEEGYASGDGRFRYELDGSALVVNGTLRIEGFQDGDLGIRLVEESGVPQAAFPAAERVLLGDSRYDWQLSGPPTYGFDPYGNPTADSWAGSDPGKDDWFDRFPGTPGATRFVMGGGNDVIQDMLGGDDWIDAGTGDDAAWGGAGNDVVEGGAGRDIVAGGSGDDFLYAGSYATLEADLADVAEVPRVYPGEAPPGGGQTSGGGQPPEGPPSGSGQPAESGTPPEGEFPPEEEGGIPPATEVPPGGDQPAGGDLLSGGEGDDTIFGDREANLIEGGAGNDRIFAGAGDDWIGADLAQLSQLEQYRVHPLNNDWVNREVDVLWTFDPLPAYSLEPPQFRGAPITARIGSASLNPFYLDRSIGGDDEIDAGSGHDTIAAGGGDDLVFGGSGDDYIDAGFGADRIFGGSGDDLIYAQWDSTGDIVEGGDGDDILLAGDGDDRLMGGAGDDSLFSGAGRDFLWGGGGNDLLAVNVGGDVVDGGEGKDRIAIAAAGQQPTVIRMAVGSGADLVQSRAGSVIVEMAGEIATQEVSVARVRRSTAGWIGNSTDVEVLDGIELAIGDGGDSIFLADPRAEVASASSLQVSFADGTVWDDAFLDSLLSAPEATGPSAPVLGSAGPDVLFGTAQGSTLSGGSGDDWLIGGAGDDRYEYSFGDGFDQVEDSGGQDVLRFAEGTGAADVGVYASGADYILSVGEGGVRLRGGRTAEGAVERVDFADGTSWSPADLQARAELLPDNRAPAMAASLGRVAVDPGSPLQVVLPDDAGRDPDRFDAVDLYAITAAGERLPDWLHFDAATRTLAGTPTTADAGAHDVLLIAADSNGAAAAGVLSIQVGPADLLPDSATPPPEPAAPPPSGGQASARAGSDAAFASEPLPIVERRDNFLPSGPSLEAVADGPFAAEGAADPLYRGMLRSLDDLLRTGRANLGEEYAEAIREFEERRLEREAEESPAFLEEEVEAWNKSMHDWHDRHPGYAEGDLGGVDGAWRMGWGSPGAGGQALGGSMSVEALLSVANPAALPRLGGVASQPTLAEGFANLR